MTRRLFSLFAIAFLATGSSANDLTTNILEKWNLIGNGFVVPVDDAILLSEYPGSNGVMLVSPDVYGSNVSLSFDVLPQNPESVLVAMVSTSNSEKGLAFPADYGGGIAYLLEAVNGYFFAFHNAAHKRTPFVRQHPYSKGTSTDLASSSENVMSQQWHRVEIDVRANGELQLRIDGIEILSTDSPDPLRNGKIVLRLRGTKTHTASALFRNIHAENR